MDAAKLSIHQSGNQEAALQQKQHQQQNQLNAQLQQQQHLQHYQQQLQQQQNINLQLQQQQQLQASQQQHVHNGHQQQQMQVQHQPHLSPFNANSASNPSTGGKFGAPNTNNNKNTSNSNLSQAAQQQQQQQGILNAVPLPNGAGIGADMVPPRSEKMSELLLRRIEHYRQRQTDCMSRYEQTLSTVCEQQNHETSELQKRFLENKNIRTTKKTEKKPIETATTTLSNNLKSSEQVNQKFLKRTAGDAGFGSENLEPPHKLQNNNNNNDNNTSNNSSANSKYSIKIGQQLGLSTSTANTQPQQMSTNVTVKTLTNNSVKSDVSTAGDGGPNSNFPSSPEFMGDDTTEGNKIFEDLINHLEEFDPDFFDALDEKLLEDITTENDAKVEQIDFEDLLDSLEIKSENPMAQVSATFGRPSDRGPDSAQINTGKMGPNGPMNLGNFSEPNEPSQQQQSQRQNSEQQLLYPSYNAPMDPSPAGNQSTAGYNFMQGPQQQKQSQPQKPQSANRREPNPKQNTPSMDYGGAQSPCGSNINPDISQQQTTTNTLQTQQLHFIQQGGAHDTQVSAGQHLHLSGVMKSNVSVAAQQSMNFSQQQQQNPTAQQVPANVRQNQNKNPSAASASNNRTNEQKGRSGPGTNNGPYNSSSQRVPDGPNPTGSNTGLVNLMCGPGGPNFKVPDMAASNMSMGGMGPGVARNPHQMTKAANFNPNIQNMHRQQNSGMAGTRPPLPEYKATQVPLMQAQLMQQIVDGGGRFPNVAEQAVDVRKITEQPIPPSDTMMRPQHSASMQHSAASGPLSAMGVQVALSGQQKPPQTLVGMPMGSQEEWRRTMMPQQQMSFTGVSGGYMGYEPVASTNNGFMGNSHGGPMINGLKPGMQLIPAQIQQQMVRQQQQQQKHVPSQQMMGGSNSSKPNDMLMQQIMQQQSLQQGGPQGQGCPNAMMTQKQMVSMRMPQQNVTTQQQQQFVQQATTTYQQQQQQTLQMSQQGPGNITTGSNAFNVPRPVGNNNVLTSNSTSLSSASVLATSTAAKTNQNITSVFDNTNDLCLELLDNLSVDVDNFSTEDLTTLLDNDNFNIDDILQ